MTPGTTSILDLPAVEGSISQEPGPKSFGYISLTAGYETYTIDPFRIEEVINPLPITVLPNLPDPIRGIAANRGEIIAVFDLSAALGKQQRSVDHPKLIVLRAENGQSKFAFEVSGLTQLPFAAADSFEESDEPQQLDIDSVLRELERRIT